MEAASMSLSLPMKKPSLPCPTFSSPLFFRLIFFASFSHLQALVCASDKGRYVCAMQVDLGAMRAQVAAMVDRHGSTPAAVNGA